jgi:prepilin-type N-terminal cleavage/methylation domain-containing protein
MQNRVQWSGVRVQGSATSGQCLHPSSFNRHPSQRGLTLIEVLISIFVLSVGLLGVAAIIPLGQLALWETAKADRCGACGRAALREIQTSRLLDFRYWYWTPGPSRIENYWGFYPPFPFSVSSAIADDFATVSASTDSLPFVIDPLGRAKGMPVMFGQTPSGGATVSICLPRRTLRTMPLMPGIAPQQLINAQLFYWADDLPFNAPKNSAQRPVLVPARDPVSGATSVVSQGDYSWFFSVLPAASDAQIDYRTSPPTVSPLPVAQRRVFNVSVAVCYKRNFRVYDPSNLYPGNSTAVRTMDAEQAARIEAGAGGFPGMGLGGGTVQPNDTVNAKENEWVMLYHVDDTYPARNRCNWYRVVGVGTSTNTLSLDGSDWDSSLSAVLVVVPGVIGVYNTTMELDWDPLWTK